MSLKLSPVECANNVSFPRTLTRNGDRCHCLLRFSIDWLDWNYSHLPYRCAISTCPEIRSLVQPSTGLHHCLLFILPSVRKDISSPSWRALNILCQGLSLIKLWSPFQPSVYASLNQYWYIWHPYCKRYRDRILICLTSLFSFCLPFRVAFTVLGLVIRVGHIFQRIFPSLSHRHFTDMVRSERCVVPCHQANTILQAHSGKIYTSLLVRADSIQFSSTDPCGSPCIGRCIHPICDHCKIACVHKSLLLTSISLLSNLQTI